MYSCMSSIRRESADLATFALIAKCIAVLIVIGFYVDHVFYEASAQNIDKYRAQATRGLYTDIYDGSVYQQLILNKHTQLSYISVIFNTNGFPVFRSSQFAFWLLYLLINELPYQMRYEIIIILHK